MSIASYELAEASVTSAAPVAAIVSVVDGDDRLTVNDRLVVTDADHAAVTRWAHALAPCDGEDFHSLSEDAFRAL